jgi:hypothetical protein
MSNDYHAQSGCGVTNSIRADPRGFMSTNDLDEKDTVAYRSRTWIHMHDVWVLCEGHDMVSMLLTGHMIHLCQYLTYGGGQEGTFLTWG